MNDPRNSANDLATLYRDAIRRHAAEPVGYQVPIDATHRHEEYNPLCGDRIEVALLIRHGCIEVAAFDGEACAICMASASLLCKLAPGQTPRELRQLSQQLQQGLGIRGASDPVPNPELPVALRPLLGVRPYPSRVRCATLPWTAAGRALKE